MDIPILFEDESLLIIDKPSGLVVNNAESVQGTTVQDWVARRLTFSPDTAAPDFAERAGIVHRIDRETSGVLVIAKTLGAFTELQRQFKEREVHKTYLAIVHGRLEPGEGEIRAPVGRLPWNRERFGVVVLGKEAVTAYSVRSIIDSIGKTAGPPETLSVVELFPKTGRTHQIRVHLKYIGYPIVGDFLYAGRKVSRNDREWAPRVMLHAWKISILHPNSREQLAIEAPIPDDMRSIIENRPRGS